MVTSAGGKYVNDPDGWEEYNVIRVNEKIMLNADTRDVCGEPGEREELKYDGLI